jgi:hypothetical protein
MGDMGGREIYAFQFLQIKKAGNYVTSLFISLHRLLRRTLVRSAILCNGKIVCLIFSLFNPFLLAAAPHFLCDFKTFQSRLN